MSWLTGYLGNQPIDSGANSRPSRGQARVNYAEVSDEEDLQEGLIFDSPLTSPQRPAQSPSASPRALLIPDPPLTEEVLQKVQDKLTELPEEEVVEGHIVGQPEEGGVGNVVNMPDEDVVVIDFEDETGEDGANVSEHLRNTWICFIPFCNDFLETMKPFATSTTRLGIIL